MMFSIVRDWAITAMVVCALGASGLAAARVLQGPTQADRVVALDIFLATAVALCVGAALMTEETALLDVGLVVALVGFVGTLGWAHMIDAEKPGGGTPGEKPHPNAEALE